MHAHGLGVDNVAGLLQQALRHDGVELGGAA